MAMTSKALISAKWHHEYLARIGSRKYGRQIFEIFARIVRIKTLLVKVSSFFCGKERRCCGFKSVTSVAIALLLCALVFRSLE